MAPPGARDPYKEEIKRPQQGFLKAGQVQESTRKTQSASHNNVITHLGFFFSCGLSPLLKLTNKDKFKSSYKILGACLPDPFLFISFLVLHIHTLDKEVNSAFNLASICRSFAPCQTKMDDLFHSEVSVYYKCNPF